MTRQLIGVDVGGTKISAASLRDGTIDRTVVVELGAGGSEQLLDQIEGLVRSLWQDDVAAIGVGVPSVVEFASGRAKTSVNVPFADVPLRTILRERLGLPVFVDNDGACAALAEAHDGERMTTQNLCMFTVGTGVGGGLVLGGRVYRGATGAAAEIGHTLVGLDLESSVPTPADFPQPGSLESFAAGPVLDRLGAEQGYARPGDVVTAALDGDPKARALVDLIGRRLGIGIANAINTFDPDEVVIGGGVAAHAGKLLLEPARATARGFVLPGVGEATEIRLARYGAEAGVRGAALLAGLELDAGTDTGPVPERKTARRTARVRDAMRVRRR
jgi:glucokinase